MSSASSMRSAAKAQALGVGRKESPPRNDHLPNLPGLLACSTSFEAQTPQSCFEPQATAHEQVTRHYFLAQLADSISSPSQGASFSRATCPNRAGCRVQSESLPFSAFSLLFPACQGTTVSRGAPESRLNPIPTPVTPLCLSTSAAAFPAPGVGGRRAPSQKLSCFRLGNVGTCLCHTTCTEWSLHFLHPAIKKQSSIIVPAVPGILIRGAVLDLRARRDRERRSAGVA